MAFPSRTLRAVCEISSGTLQISQRPPAYTHEEGALSVVVDLKNNGAAYVPDASVVAGMYLFWQDTQYMSELVEMVISGCTLSGIFSDALTAMPGCPMLVIQLQDTDTSDIIVAAAAPIQITKIEGNMIVTTRPPSPSEIVYIGRSPYINTLNNHWMQWNSTDHAYEDTGVVARGVPATFTATAQGLPAGSTPTATITGTAENPVINLGIPKGDTGDTGATGPAAGFGTIAATVDNTSGTPAVSVTTSGPDTAKNITFAFTGLKGPQGATGPVQTVCGVAPDGNGDSAPMGSNMTVSSSDSRNVAQAISDLGATFTGATSSTAGTKGQTPAPAAGDEEKLLTGAGTWEKITGSDLEASSSDTTKIATVLSNLNDQIEDLQEGIAIIVDGDTASVAVPVGGYAYVKNNTHGLTEGLYKNTSASAFPVSGGTANSSVFSAVPLGGLNALYDNLTFKSGIYTNGYAEVSAQQFFYNDKIAFFTGDFVKIGGGNIEVESSVWREMGTVNVKPKVEARSTISVGFGATSFNLMLSITTTGIVRLFQNSGSTRAITEIYFSISYEI